jgi:DNA (cytosine-5)-methyltransferase 1
MASSFSVVSTFSGCGGSSLGYQMAGGKVLLAVEWDNDAVDCYRTNHPETDIYHGDIHNLTVDEVMRRTGLGPGELDILDGSPPCQGFSAVRGKDTSSDPRNNLFREYIRLLRGLQPRAFVMENVPGMAAASKRPIMANIFSAMTNSGYKVAVRILDASWYGVPQRRKRVIFVGVRDDIDAEPGHPEPTHKVPSGMKRIPDGTEIILTGKQLRTRAAHKQRHTAAGNSWHKSTQLEEGRPSPTVTKTSVPSSSSSLFWPEPNGGIRMMSVSELKYAGGFPGDYKFRDRASAQARIGNSVPPAMMYRIAAHIRDEILGRINDGAAEEATDG